MTSQENKHKQSVHTDINAQIILGTNQVCMYVGTWDDVFDEYKQLKKENDKLTQALNKAEDALKFARTINPKNYYGFIEIALAEIKKIKGE